MENELIKQRIEDIWCAIKQSKAADLQRHLATVRERVTLIIGSNEIERIKHSSLLKLLIYELIVFADQHTTAHPVSVPHKTVEKGQRAMQRLEEIKELVYAMSQSTVGQLSVELGKFKTLLHRLKGLERELLREEEERRRASHNQSDSEGTQLMIEQLQDIIRRKENRIRELNVQLEENFNDKQQLEEEIDHLQLANSELQAKLREMEGNSLKADSQVRELQAKLAALQQQFQRHKLKEKDELLFGVNSYTIIEHKQKSQQSTQHYEPPPSVEPITNSTKNLAHYFQQPQRQPEEEQTVKKKPVKVIESEEEDDLLISIRPPSPPSPVIENGDHCLQRMLLMQAIFIENFLDCTNNRNPPR